MLKINTSIYLQRSASIQPRTSPEVSFILVLLMLSPLVPGMSLCDDDTDMDAGTAEHPGSLSLSTSAANQKKIPQQFDIFSDASGSEESMDMYE